VLTALARVVFRNSRIAAFTFDRIRQIVWLILTAKVNYVYLGAMEKANP